MRYVLATSGSRLFSVRIQTSFSTNAVLSIKPISKANGMFSRVGDLFGGTTLDPQGGIVALAASRSSAPKNQTSWAVYAATNHVIQEWKFVEDRPEVSFTDSDCLKHALLMQNTVHRRNGCLRSSTRHFGQRHRPASKWFHQFGCC